MPANEKIDLFKQFRKTEYAQPKSPILVDVGEGTYLAIEGQEEPGGEEFSTKDGALYAIAYTVKMTRKFDGRQDYVVGKLEGQWWSDRGDDLEKVPRSEWRWKLMIRTPDFVGRDEVKRAASDRCAEIVLDVGSEQARPWYGPVHGQGGSVPLVIEKARPEDRPRIFELLEQANMHHIPSPEMPEVTWENYFVARLDGEVVGFCGYRILSPTEAKTELMVVDAECRGMGIGYRLQERRMEDMLARGVRTLTTNADLPASIAFYKKHFGYREVGTLEKIHEFGDPEIDRWTTLRVDLVEWGERRKKGK